MGRGSPKDGAPTRRDYVKCAGALVAGGDSTDADRPETFGDEQSFDRGRVADIVNGEF